MVLVVHITCTSLVGAPLRVVDALNRYTNYATKLVNLGAAKTPTGENFFSEDLDWLNDRQEAIELISKADILHFHHPFDINSDKNPFEFDFRANMKSGCRTIWQFHSAPSRYSKEIRELVVSNKWGPSFVIPHLAERYFPYSRLVPNLTPEYANTPIALDGGVNLFFSPSKPGRSAWEHRWETKAEPETDKILKRVCRNVSGTRYTYLYGKPLSEIMLARQNADIVIDDLVTGSLHLTTLETLSLGRVAVTYNDQRIRTNILRLTGAPDIPVVNVRLEEAECVLTDLCRQKELVKELGDAGLDWFRTYYRSQDLVGHFVDGYDDLLDSEGKFREVTNLQRSDIQSQHGFWLHQKKEDIVWTARRQNSLGRLRRWVEFKHLVSRLKRKLKRTLANWSSN